MCVIKIYNIDLMPYIKSRLFDQCMIICDDPDFLINVWLFVIHSLNYTHESIHE